MATRNFYVRGFIDGRKTDIGAGPRRKDGGMSITLTQREEGSIVTALNIECYVNDSGQLVTNVFHGGKNILHYVTER